MGAAPLYFGKIDACTFIPLCFGASSNFSGIICPYAAVIIISGFQDNMCSIASESLIFQVEILLNSIFQLKLLQVT